MDNFIRYFPFFNSVKQPVTTAGISEPFFNAGYDLMTLEISDSAAISATVEGCVNNINADGNQVPESECSYSNLTIFNSSYKIVESITANGIYYIGISGCSRVRVNVAALSGATKIVGAVEK